MFNKLGEKIILSKLKARDADAFSMVYDKYADNIYRFIYFKVNSREEAEDLTADVFLRVWNYIQEGSVPENIKAFLYKVAKNAVIDFYRTKKEYVNIDDIEIVNKDEYKKILNDLDNKREFDKIIKLLQGLKEEYREVLVLKFVDGYNNKEIAQILDRNIGAIRVLIHRSISALKKKI